MVELYQGMFASDNVGDAAFLMQTSDGELQDLDMKVGSTRSYVNARIVNSMLQRRPSVHDRSRLHPLYHLARRVLLLLDRTPWRLRCARQRARSPEALHACPEVVPEHVKATIC